MKSYTYGGMTPFEIVKLIRVEQHNVTNKLQVIYGYLQLGKKEEALKYTRKAIDTLERKSRIAKIHSSNLVLLIMNILQDTTEMGVQQDISFSGFIEKINREDDVCMIIDKVYVAIRGELLRCESEKRYLKLKINSDCEDYVLKLCFSCNLNEIFIEERERVLELAKFYNIPVSFECSANEGLFVIKLDALE